MRRTLTRILIIAAMLTVSSIVPACRPDGEDGPVSLMFTDIATFEGNISADGGAVFTLRQDGDSPLATIRADRALDTADYPEGSRMLIYYTNTSNAPYTSGPVNLIGGYRVTQGSVSGWNAEEYSRWDADPVWLNSVWRTGTWLNFNLRLPYCAEKRIFTVALGPDLTPEGRADIYLVHILPAGATESFMRGYYASFDIAEVWDNPDVKEIRLHISSSNLGAKEFSFVKIP